MFFPTEKLHSKDRIQDYEKQCAQMGEIQLCLSKSVNSIAGLLKCTSQQSQEHEPKRKKGYEQPQDTYSFDED